MKANSSYTRRLSLGCVLALSLVSTVCAQPVLPGSGGTNIPPSSEELAARWTALVAAQNGKYTAEFAPWIVREVFLPGGSPLTTVGLQSLIRTNALSLAARNFIAHTQQQAVVSAYVQTNTTGFLGAWQDSNGNPHVLDHLDARGVPRYKTTFNVESAQTIGADRLWPGGISGMNLTGTNLPIGLLDGGDPLTNHQEFIQGNLRVLEIFGPSPRGISSHATHTCGTIAAWGLTNAAKGLAHRATVWATSFDDDFTKMPVMAVTNGGVRVSNHSYGYPGGWNIENIGGTYYWVWWGDTALGTNQDWRFGYYDAIARTNDQVIYTAQTYLPVFSAGNEGGSVEHGPSSQPVYHWEFTNGTPVFNNEVRPLDDANGGFHTITTYAVSKNALVVGAVNALTNGYGGSNTVVLGTFSSCGPTAEGRIKPDISAAGVDIYSTVSSSETAYATASGTSMSAPAVTGALGLLTELHQRFYGTNQPMLASTLKGIVIATADEAGANAGPDYRFGWGLLNAQAAANLMTNNYASGSLPMIKEVRLASGDSVEFPVVLTNGQPFRPTVVWTDPAATPVTAAVNPTNHMLINDVDLRIISPGGTTYFPWVLNPNSPANAATTGDNSVDNVEQVSIPNPAKGTYLVRVTHKGSLIDDLGQTNYLNLSIILPGVVPQPPILPEITSIMALAASNTIALKWSSEVGRFYRVKYADDIESSSWQYASGELSALRTNMTFVLSATGVTNRFYVIEQVR